MARYSVLMLRKGVKPSRATRDDTKEVRVINVWNKQEAKEKAEKEHHGWKSISCKSADMLDPDARR